MERSIAKILGDWWGVPFRRTPSSGAWNTQSRNMGHGTTDFHGDIVAPPEANFPFSVECKAYADIELYKALYAKSNIFAFWDQCLEDARAVGKLPMLVLKENRKKALVAISLFTHQRLFKDKPNYMPRHYMKMRWTNEEGRTRTVFVFDLETFVSSVPHKYVKRVLNAQS